MGGDFGSVASGASLVIAGDLNRDGVVTLADWVAFKANVNLDTSALGTTAQTIAGDFDHSGRVGLEDLTRFGELFDAANGTGAFQAALNIPEPSGIALAISSFIGSLSWRPARCL